MRAKRSKMARAFRVLQDPRAGAEPVVTQARWTQLVRLVQPEIRTAHRELLWSVSDTEAKGYIGQRVAPATAHTAPWQPLTQLPGNRSHSAVIS